MGFNLPDHVVVPIASGSQLTKVDKGFEELKKVGLVNSNKVVRISGAQATGCSPVAQAFRQNDDFIRPVKPDTIAKSLAIGNPADGYYAMEAVRNTGGSIESASDPEIVEGIKLLARTEGIFTETAGGVTVANLVKLVESGVVDKDEVVVALITGHGLKTVEAIESSVGPTVTIEPKLNSFMEAYSELEFSSEIEVE